MNNKKMHIYAAVPLLFLASSAGNAAEPPAEKSLERAAGTEFFFSDDSEGFQTQKLSAEFLMDYTYASDYQGIRASAYHYKIADWSEDGQKVSYIAKHIDPKTANGWYADAGVFNQGRHTLLTFDGSYRTALAEKTAVEVFANRDWVETKPALEDGIHFTFAGASFDQGLGEHVTLVGLAGSQFFSDDNRRDHGRLKLIYQPSLNSGLTLQARYRMFHSDQTELRGYYFNPEDYQESMLAIGWRKHFSGWSAGVTAGLGCEKINHDASQNTHLLEMSLQSPIHGTQYLNLSAGYNRSASYYGPDYDFGYLKGEWVIRF